MTIDEIIDVRWQARQAKQYAESDLLREVLDEELVFTFDHKDYQEVQYLTEKYFANKPANMTNRQYVEHRMRQDRQAEATLQAWIYSNSKLTAPRR